MSEWIDVKDRTPEEGVPVWCLDAVGGIFIGGYVYEDGWLWGNCYFSVYHSLKDGKWIWCANDCEVDDDYQVLKWMELPAPPTAADDQEATP